MKKLKLVCWKCGCHEWKFLQRKVCKVCECEMIKEEFNNYGEVKAPAELTIVE